MSIELEQILENTRSIQNLESQIVNNIIPRMMRRRDRKEPLTREEIVGKLFNVLPDKPGEAVELFRRELLEKGFKLTPSLASEIADIVYYTSQLNCPDYIKDPSPLFESLGINMEQARIFCILKYEVRLKCGGLSNHKELENNILGLYLNN